MFHAGRPTSAHIPRSSLGETPGDPRPTACALRGALAALSRASSLQEILLPLLERSLEDDQDELNREEAKGEHPRDALAKLVSTSLIESIMPLAQRQMESMRAHDRRQIMAWLSDPEPIAEQVKETLERLLGDAAMVQEVSQEALNLASSVAANAPALQGLLQGVTHENIEADLEHLRDGGTSVPRASEAELSARAAKARRIAAEASATALSALQPPMGGSASATAPSASSVGARWQHDRGSMARRASGRLALRQRLSPIVALDEDALRSVFDGLSVSDLLALMRTGHAGRLAVRRAVRSTSWQARYGCLHSDTLCKVVCESGVARLDVGIDGREDSMHHLPSTVRAERRRSTGGPMGAHGARVRFERLDGPSVGPVSCHHVVSICCVDGCHRLDLGRFPIRPQVTTRESGSTRLYILPETEARPADAPTPTEAPHKPLTHEPPAPTPPKPKGPSPGASPGVSEGLGVPLTRLPTTTARPTLVCYDQVAHLVGSDGSPCWLDLETTGGGSHLLSAATGASIAHGFAGPSTLSVPPSVVAPPPRSWSTRFCIHSIGRGGA